MRSALAAALLFALACGGSEPTAGPPEIRYGLDECAYCRMIIMEARYAAVARSDSGEEARFDDLRGLREFLREAEGSWQAWVHGEEGWIPAEEAWYVRDPEEITPMGSGLLAFEHREAAARAGLDPMNWSELLASPSVEEAPMFDDSERKSTLNSGG